MSGAVDCSLGALEALLDEFFAPVTSNARKHEIETGLEQFGHQKSAFRAFLTFLSTSGNPYVSMFCLTGLEVSLFFFLSIFSDEKDLLTFFFTYFLAENY